MPQESNLPAKVGVICLNAGLLHRVGPFRMNVELANYLQAKGIPTLRFDLSSIGDSGANKGDRDYVAQVVKDVSSAADLMRSHTGLEKFVLIGLCTGADNAHRAMVADHRFVAGIFLDGYAYPTLKYRLRRYLPVVINPIRFTRVILTFIKPFIHRLRGDEKPPDSADSMFTWELPEKNQTEQEIRALIDRGSILLYIFSGGSWQSYNYPEQFVDSMPFLRDHAAQFSVILDKSIDHTYSLYGDRMWLYDKVFQFLSRLTTT